MSKKEVNINDSFSKLMHFCFPRYLGKVIEKVAGGFVVFGKTYLTWEEATKAIDEHYENLQESVNRLK